MNKKSHFSLFSGAGGLDLGFEKANNYELLFGNDILEDAVETFSENFNVKKEDNTEQISSLPAVVCKDVSQINFENLEDANPDVLVGGPPCQDFSITRGPKEERQGIKVKRGRLYAQFIRALVHLQPKVFVFENVPGLKSANKGKAYETIQKDLVNLNSKWGEISKIVNNSSGLSPEGYTLLYNGILDASHLGVPQGRRRLIIVGLREDLLDNAWWGGETVGLKKKVNRFLKGKNDLFRKYPLTVLELFEGDVLTNLKGKYRELMKSYEVVAEDVGTETAKKWREKKFEKNSFDALKDYIRINNINSEGDKEIKRAMEAHKRVLKEMGYYGTPVNELSLPDDSNKKARESKSVIERMRRIPPGENHDFVRDTQWEVEGRSMSFVYKRLHPLKPSYTVVAKGGGGTWGYHYDRERSRLTNRERARIQTFPDDFLFRGSKSEIRSQIGEAVPPLMAQRIAEAVSEVISELEETNR